MEYYVSYSCERSSMQPVHSVAREIVAKELEIAEEENWAVVHRGICFF